MAKTSLGKVSVLPKGEYSSVIQYSRLDIVTYKGSSYLCIKDSLGIEITNEEYWQLLAQKGDTGETGATGAKGDKGDAGKDFSIYKTYPSISAMESDASNVPEGEFVLIASDVEDTDNAKLYVKSNTGFVYLTDLSGATGIKGEKGDKPINGVDYNTPEEKEEFKNEVVENATVEVEQNIANIQEQAIQEFNSNASTKTNEYNSNTTTKLQEYNTNANTKIEEYNSNATQKTNTFNGNATTQIETFNNNATSKTNDFNSNASTKTEEFNTVVDAEKEQFSGQTEAINHHIAIVNNELERVKNDVLETGTDTDTYIHLEDSAMAEYQELSVDGVCEQETTTGNQLLDAIGVYISGSSNKHLLPYTFNGITFTKKQGNNNTVIANGTCTENITLRFNLVGVNTTSIYSKTPRLENKYSLKISEVTSNYSYVKDFISNTISSGFKIPELSSSNNKIVAVLIINKDTELVNEEIPLYLVENIKYKYEKFTGEQASPNPEYPQPISVIENSLKVTSCNKNLLKLSMGEISLSDGQDIESTTICRTNEYIKIGNNQSIIVSGTLNENPNLRLYDINKNYKGYGAFNSNGIYTNTNSEVAYFRIRYAMGEYTLDQLNNSLMIEYGTQKTPYEQHLESQITANLPEGEFIGKIDDTYKDTLKVEYNEEDGEYHLMLYKILKKYTFTGNEIFSLSSTNSNYIEFFANSIIRDAANSLPTLSNYFLYNINNRIAIGNTGTYIRVPVACGIDTADKFKEFLSSNEVYVYYVLATSRVIDLGIIDMLLTYNEVTNLFTDSDLMPTINAKYYRNFISTVRNLQVNEKSLKQELIDINNRLSALESATTNVASESEVVE